MLTLLLFEAYLLSRWHRRKHPQENSQIHHHPEEHFKNTGSDVHPSVDYDKNKKNKSGISWWPVTRILSPFHYIFGIFATTPNNLIEPESPKFDKNRNKIRKSISYTDIKTATASAEGNHPGGGLSGMSLEDKFRAAVKVIHSLPKDGPYQPSNGTKLKFYGLYKQSTDGPCNVSRPAFWDVVGRYKWDAWNTLGKMSKDNAMSKYVDGLKEIVETMSFDGNVQDFLESIGPFYEFVNLQGSQMNHIKEAIDRLTSSSSSGTGSSSSGSSSLTTSPINSCPNSPLKSLQDSADKTDRAEEDDENDDVEGEDALSSSVHVDTSTKTATYETLTSTTATMNGYHHKPTSQNYEPPPSPMHTYNQNPRKSSVVFLQQHRENGIDEQDEEEDETILLEKTACKEDLEFPDNTNVNGETMQNGGKHLSNRISLDTIATTSGTESEKYYSGDSEPDFEHFEDRMTMKGGNHNFQNQNHVGHDYYAVVARGKQSAVVSQNGIGNGVLVNGNGVATRRQKSSPKANSSQQQGLNQLISPRNSVSPHKIQAKSGDLVLHNTVERLNRDIDHILARLRILETAYASSVGVNPDSPGGGRTQNGRPRRRSIFGGMSYSSAAFVLLWPFVAHFLIKLISWWWNSRRRRLFAQRIPRLQ